MITKILNILLKNCHNESDNPKNNMNWLFLNLLLMAGMVTLFVILVSMLFASSPSHPYSVEQNISILAMAVLYSVCWLLVRKISFKVSAIIGLILSVATSICLELIFPYDPFLYFMSITIPIYCLVAMKQSYALIGTILAAVSLSLIKIWQEPVNLVALVFSMVAMVAVYCFLAVLMTYGDRLIEEGNEQSIALTESVNKKRDFISKLSHRIRTPLSNILGITNILDDNSDSAKKQLIESLRASVNTITDIVEIIDEESNLSPTREREAIVEDEVTTFDLQELITQTGEFIHNLEVKLEVYGQLPLLKGKSAKIRRIFSNIFNFFLQNTPKEHLPANITIVVNRVRIPINPIKYRFDIKSNIAIDEPAHDHDAPELMIAQKLIEELNGNIKRRFEDDFTCIYFNICFDGEDAAAVSARPNPDHKVVVNTTGFTKTVRQKELAEVDVVVCDDNPINQKVMSLSLDKHVKSITLAANGQECVDLLQKGKYDIVLMDIQMPVLDGYGATQKIRGQERGSDRHIPIIAVTANTLAGDRQHCLSVGMDDYVSKPFQLDDVLSKMKDLVSKYPQG